MSLNWKRIALLVGFIAGVLLFGYLLYYIFFKPSLPTQPPVNTNTGQPAGGGLPTVGGNTNIPIAGNVNGALPGGETTGTPTAQPPIAQPGAEVSPVASGGVTAVSVLTSTSAYQPALAADGQNAIYYDPATGKFYQISPSGKTTPFSDQVFFNVQSVSWSSDRSKAVLEYPDGANIIYNFETKKQVTLPSHWKEFSFSPTNQQLVFKSMGLTPENRWIAVVNADGSQAKKIESLGDKDATVHPLWSPNGQIIGMFTEDKEFDRQNLYFLGANGENYKSMIIDGRDFRGVWSSRGDKLLYSVYSSDNDYKPTLWITTAQGENIGQGKQSLKVDTWADHCSFADNDTVYCAVPQNLARGSGIFANDLDNQPSDIYKIDLKNGFRSKIATPERSYNIQKVFVSDDQSILYFNSKNDGRLYGIRLK